jgi:hypothetical protein
MGTMFMLYVVQKNNVLTEVVFFLKVYIISDPSIDVAPSLQVSMHLPCCYCGVSEIMRYVGEVASDDDVHAIFC